MDTLSLLPQAALTGLLLGCIYTVIALGLSVTLGILGMMQVAHGSVVLLGAYVALALGRRTGLDPLLSIGIVGPLFFGLGGLLEPLLQQQTERPRPAQITVLVFFGLMLTIEGLITLGWTTDTQILTSKLSGTPLTLGGVSLSLIRLLAAALALLLVLGVHLFLQRTRLGTGIRALAAHREAALLCGLPTRWLSRLVFGLAMALAGVGGVLLGLLFPFTPSDETHWLAWSFLVVVTGGLGRVSRTLCAGLLLGLLEALGGVLLPFRFVELSVYVLLLLAFLWRGQGLWSIRQRTI